MAIHDVRRRLLNGLTILIAPLFFTAIAGGSGSVLTGIEIQSAQQRATTQLVLHFSGTVPFGWRLARSGQHTFIVLLPGTAESSSMAQSSDVHSTLVSGLSVNPRGNETDVSVTLNSDARIVGRIVGRDLQIDISPLVSPPVEFSVKAPVERTAATAYEVVPLKYADVSEIVGVLDDAQQITPNDTFQPEGSVFTLPSSVNGNTAPQQQLSATNATQTQSVGQRIDANVAIDRRLNAVILSGAPDKVRQIKDLIKVVDVPLPTVMLQCEVVELNESAARDLGLDFTSGPGSAIAGGGIVVANGNAGSTSGGIPPGLSASASLNAHLFATIAHGGGRILATPRVAALSGEPAQILTGDALPIIQTTIFPGSPAITQITTSYIAVGVNLQIQPRVTTDGFVTSHIFAEVSSVTAYVPTTQGPVPQISLRQATTTATVADGVPFIIGGLLKDEEIRNMSRLPILGDIPLIGGLFRVRHDSDSKTNLYVIITPHILHNSSALPFGLPQPSVPGPTPSP